MAAGRILVEEVIPLEAAFSKRRALLRQFLGFLKIGIAFWAIMFGAIELYVREPLGPLIGALPVFAGISVIVAALYTLVSASVKASDLFPLAMRFDGTTLAVSTPHWNESFGLDEFRWDIGSGAPWHPSIAFLPAKKFVRVCLGESRVMVACGVRADKRQEWEHAFNESGAKKAEGLSFRGILAAAAGFAAIVGLAGLIAWLVASAGGNHRWTVGIFLDGVIMAIACVVGIWANEDISNACQFAKTSLAVIFVGVVYAAVSRATMLALVVGLLLQLAVSALAGGIVIVGKRFRRGRP
jgi:hypothetical protein